MKKVFTFFLAMAIIFGISGCGKKEYIVFPFSASDVVKIETYYSNSEADTKEKTLTEEADVARSTLFNILTIESMPPTIV